MNAEVPASVHNAWCFAKEAQQEWVSRPLRVRSQVIGCVAGEIAANAQNLVAAVERPATEAEILASEVLPLAEACKFAARQLTKTLSPRDHRSGGAWWMGRITVQTLREPWGTILIIAPWNYPLLLAGAQAVQAIAAGNAVLLKPSPGCEKISEMFADCCQRAGAPAGLIQVLPSDVAAAQSAINLGVDKVVLTGSAATGRVVLKSLADRLTPSTMELSGCDSVFVLPDADLPHLARCLAFALKLNHGATCIAPRRIFATAGQQSVLLELLRSELANCDSRPLRAPVFQQVRALVRQALEKGASIAIGDSDFVNLSSPIEMRPTVMRRVTTDMDLANADVFAPITSLVEVESIPQALEVHRRCKYQLAASVFGDSVTAQRLAGQVSAGCVVINDIVVPTADPRVAFGGRGESGWGVTRGIEGLLEMTRPKVVCTRRGKWLPHLDPKQSKNAKALLAILGLVHGSSWRTRMKALMQLIQSR